MKKTFATLAVAGLLAAGGATAASAAPSEQACWGQVTKAFADTETGIMGSHSSAEATPRVGLRNLARALVEAGEIADDSMATLGAYLDGALELGACSGL